jgi:hypothetical protein
VIDNTVDDSVDATRVLEIAHWPASTADLAEGSFYSIGGANLAPVCSGAA